VKHPILAATLTPFGPYGSLAIGTDGEFASMAVDVLARVEQTLAPILRDSEAVR